MGSVTFIQTITDYQDAQDTIEKPSVRLKPSPPLYIFNVYFDNGPHDGTFFFRKPTYCPRFSIDALSSASLTVARSIGMGGGVS